MIDIEVALTDLEKIATRELAKKHRPFVLEQIYHPVAQIKKSEQIEQYKRI